MLPTITAYSTALFATWYFVDEYALLFDAGDGLTAHLLQKARKVRHVFVSHADRDHLAGLLQFRQLNAREDFPRIYYPRDSQSFTHLARFSQQFDPHVMGETWIPVHYDEVIPLQKNLRVRTFRTEHLPFPPTMVKTMGFHLERQKRKLKPEFHGLDGREIARLRQLHGDDYVTDVATENILSYSGDSPVATDGRFEKTNILLHEATFLRIDETVMDHERAHRHSTLEGVLRMVRETDVKHLVLGHFSVRYSLEEIDTEIRRLAKLYRLTIPVYRIPPGTCVRDILRTLPVNA